MVGIGAEASHHPHILSYRHWYLCRSIETRPKDLPIQCPLPLQFEGHPKHGDSWTAWNSDSDGGSPEGHDDRNLLEQWVNIEDHRQ